MDHYVYLITALLPLAASMVMVQSDPYRALILRGILGAVAALAYTVLGAPDVALTEALVGTLLSITLYAVAVRSSMVFRLGVLKAAIASEGDVSSTPPMHDPLQPFIKDLNTIFQKRHMRVEIVPYLTPETLHQALVDKDIHATCVPMPATEHPSQASSPQPSRYTTTTRLQSLYDILQTELNASLTDLRLFT